eukprot:TRINITY_DN103364_c0_g1_i1.p1 TRINITY_DN103364_c0_g1~~TRINITY_DN103364_c0_g1_i1.p1  ORF type:complete len:357 (-),score=45.81 TRINITY_DN103364_c0_g1_i1:85-1053(-)
MWLAMQWRQPLAVLVAAMTWSELTLAMRPAELLGQEGTSAGLPEVFRDSGLLVYGRNKLRLTFIADRSDPDAAAFRIEGGREFFMSPLFKFSGTKLSDTTGTLATSMSFDSERSRWFLEAVKPHLDLPLDKISQCDVLVDLKDIGDACLATKVTFTLWKHGAAGRAVGATLGAVANGIGRFGLGAFDALTTHAKLQPKRDPLVDTTPETTTVEFQISREVLAQAEQRAAQQQAQRVTGAKALPTQRVQQSSPVQQQNNCQNVKCAIGDKVTGALGNNGQFVGTIQFVFDDGRLAVNDMKSISGGPFGIGSHAFQPGALQKVA